jgi:hypothetical protein
MLIKPLIKQALEDGIVQEALSLFGQIISHCNIELLLRSSSTVDKVNGNNKKLCQIIRITNEK